jgi:hypothetical protein
MYTEPIEERCYAYVPKREGETSRDVFSGDARRQAKWIDQRRRPSPEMVVGSASVSPSPDDETSRVAWSREAPAPGPQRRRDGGTRAANPRARRPPALGPVGCYLALLWPPHGPVHATCVHQGGGGACAPVSPTQPQRPMKRARACAQQQPRHPARQSEKAGAQKRTGASGCRRVGSLASHSCRAFVLHLVPLRRGSE